MNTTIHPSQLELDRWSLGSARSETVAHLESCARCRARVEAHAIEDRAFLLAHPAAPQRSVAQSRWTISAGLAAAAASLVAVLLWPRTEPETVRAKGETGAELLIDRDNRPFPYDDRPLREGDLLVFRTSTRYARVLVLGIEASGRAQVLIGGPDQQSLAIEPGAQRVLPLGVKLDDHPGPERIFLVFSNGAIDGAVALELLAAEYARLSPADRATLPIGTGLGDRLGAHVQSWLITKEGP